MFGRLCGWMNAQQMANQVIEEARNEGVQFIRGKLSSFSIHQNQLNSATVLTNNGTSVNIDFGNFVNCAGPFAPRVNNFIPNAFPLSLRNEVHAKVIMRDELGVIPSTAPLIIWDDPIDLPWTPSEREDLKSIGGLEAKLTERLPPGVHLRPYPNGYLLMLWDWVHSDKEEESPSEEISYYDLYPEVVLRGLSVAIPGLKPYLDKMPKTMIDGGYYTKSIDNKPLIGPGNIKNLYICTGLSGYGIMGAAGAGELLAKYVSQSSVPDYAAHFLPYRFSDPEYLKRPKINHREL